MAEKKDISPLLMRLIELGFEKVEKDDDGEIVIQKIFDRIYKGYLVPVKFNINEKHLEYLDEEIRLKKEYELIGPCSILGPQYAEILVHISGDFSKHMIEKAISELGNIKFVNGSEVIIGKASNDFVGYFRFDPDFVSFLGSQRPADIVKTNDLETFFCPPITIRISRSTDMQFTKEYALTIADTCIFHLADITHISLKIAKRWQQSGERLIFSQDGFKEPKNLDFPKSLINRKLTNFFTRAISSTVPEYQFLDFYHCLEFNFLTVSNEVLYQRLRTQLLSPSFSVTESNIDKIVLEIQKHRSEQDEVRMLGQVLKKYVSTVELESFISTYEKLRGKKVYSVEQVILGKTFSIDTSSNNVYDSLAQRIKRIRNEIVHSEDIRKRSKERWEELDNISIEDLPLMRFLAHQVIIGSSKPFDVFKIDT